MNESTRSFLKNHFPPNSKKEESQYSPQTSYYILTEKQDAYIRRVFPNMSTFNTGLLTPEDQRWVNVLILSLQKIHAYPTQQITQEILQEFYTWFETRYLPSLQYSM